MQSDSRSALPWLPMCIKRLEGAKQKLRAIPRRRQSKIHLLICRLLPPLHTHIPHPPWGCHPCSQIKDPPFHLLLLPLSAPGLLRLGPCCPSPVVRRVPWDSLKHSIRGRKLAASLGTNSWAQLKDGVAGRQTQALPGQA